MLRKVLLGDLDRDGWAAPNGQDEDGDRDYASDCPMSSAVQVPLREAGLGWGLPEIKQYWDNMSQAYTEICSGTVLLSVGISGTIPSDSVFSRIEWQVIQAGGDINRIEALALGTGGANGTPLSGINTYWERGCSIVIDDDQVPSS